MEFAFTSTLARLWSRGDTIVHPLSEGKTTGEREEEGRVGWLMRGRIEKRERAALIDPFFSSKRETVASLITEGTDCRRGRGIVFLETSVDLEIARETSRFLIPFPKGDGYGVQCSRKMEEKRGGVDGLGEELRG